jgi:hypothetical protein
MRDLASDAMKLAECKMAEVWLRHVTKPDAEKLRDLEYQNLDREQDVLVTRFDTGWIVAVGSDCDFGLTEETNDSYRDFFKNHEFSPQFRAVVDAAQAAGIAFLRIHVHATPTDGLEIYEW